MTHSEKKPLTAEALQSKDKYLMRQVAIDDHLRQYEENIQYGLECYKDYMDDFVGYPDEQKLATISRIIHWDKTYGLGQIAHTLRLTLQDLAKVILLDKHMDDFKKSLLIDRMGMFNTIADDLIYMEAYGCSAPAVDD